MTTTIKKPKSRKIKPRALGLLRKIRSAKEKPSKRLIGQVIADVRRRHATMANDLHHPLVEKGIATLFKELGPVETIKNFE